MRVLIASALVGLAMAAHPHRKISDIPAHTDTSYTQYCVAIYKDENCTQHITSKCYDFNVCDQAVTDDHIPFPYPVDTLSVKVTGCKAFGDDLEVKQYDYSDKNCTNPADYDYLPTGVCWDRDFSTKPTYNYTIFTCK